MHAVTGVVTSVNPADNTITLKTNDGSDGVFKYQKEGKADLVFDKNVRAGTVEPATSTRSATMSLPTMSTMGFVNRTIVALKDFGPSGLKSVSGTVSGPNTM